jgi:aminotransferase
VEFARYLVREIGVAVVPGSSFYHHPNLGAQQLRFAFCKTEATLDAALCRMRKLSTTRRVPSHRWNAKADAGG